jgi:pimeloyl-ACP methyl ester carboxylesterase
MPFAADLYYYTYQSGELESLPVVLLHGAGGNHLYWPAEVRRLPGMRIFAPDLPGHGKSSGRGQQSIEAYMHAVLQWMQAIQLDQAVLVGHSMGSAIALSLAYQYPEMVLGLGLVGSSPRLRVHPEIQGNAGNPTTVHKAIDMIIAGSFSPDTPRRLVELAQARMAETRPSVLYGDFMACDAFDMTEQASAISQPALILCGADDRMTPVRGSQFLAGALQGSRLVVIPGAGHMVMLEKPQEVADELAAFLQTIPYQAGSSAR